MTDDLKDEDISGSGAGKPDAEVARLESLLARYRHQGTMPPFRIARRRRMVSIVLPVLSAAASLTLVAVAAWFGLTQRTTGGRCIARGHAARGRRADRSNRCGSAWARR